MQINFSVALYIAMRYKASTQRRDGSIEEEFNPDLWEFEKADYEKF